MTQYRSLYRRMCGPQSRSGRVRKISPQPGFDPRTVQPRSQLLYRLSYPGSQVLKKDPERKILMYYVMLSLVYWWKSTDVSKWHCVTFFTVRKLIRLNDPELSTNRHFRKVDVHWHRCRKDTEGLGSTEVYSSVPKKLSTTSHLIMKVSMPHNLLKKRYNVSRL